jgi:hypothetical protein
MFLELFRDGGAKDDPIIRIVKMAVRRITTSRIVEMTVQRMMQYP